MYVITNRTPDGEYTPTITNSKEEAIDWLRECSINNYVAAYGPLEFGNMILKYDAYDYLVKAGLVEAFIEFINEDVAETESCSKIDDESSIIWYMDETYNNMTIYEFPGKIVV